MNIKKKELVFSNEDYNSKNGFSTYIWGTCMWQFLHIISFNYPINPTDEQKKDYLQFLKLLEKTLPCKWCRINYGKNIREKDTKLSMKTMKNRETLSRWVCKLHNKVNKMLDKNEYKDYKNTRDFYEQFRARCTPVKDVNKGQHGGCNVPIHKGVKSRMVLRIVPRDSKTEVLKINKKCLCKKIIKK